MSSTNHKSAVPKFGSFKSKTAAANEESHHQNRNDPKDRKGHGSRDRMRDNPSRSRHNYLRDESKRKRHESHGHRHERVSLGDERQVADPHISTDEFEESDFFVVDRRGDPKNVEFGSLHRYGIPAHHLFGAGFVLGGPRNARIDRDASTHGQISLQSYEERPKDRSRRPLKASSKIVESRGVRVIVPKSVQDGDLDDDFIALRPSLKRKRGFESSEFHDGHYRSIEGKARPSDNPDDEDLEYTSAEDIDETEDSAQREAREINAALNRKTKGEPSHVDAWIALIEHQKNIIRPGFDEASFSTSEKRSLADIRLAIYSRAIDSMTKERAGYERLVLGRLKQGSLIWETTKLAAQWTEALKQNRSSLVLWIKYLDFVQTNQQDFRYEKCRDAYVECLRLLRDIRVSSGDDDDSKATSTQLYVLVRLVSLMRDSGYEEQAYAIWQCLLEFHLFKPQEYSGPEEALQSLEGFWESDVPRIGEDGAFGWNRRIADISSESPVFSSGTMKSRNSTLHFLPAAGVDDSDVQDPFRVVMFTDIRDVIENILHPLPKHDLINCFLCFMGLPSLRINTADSKSALMSSDPLLCFSAEPSFTSTTGDVVYDMRIKSEHNTPSQLFRPTFEKGTNLESSSDTASSKHTFVSRVLQQITSTDKDGELEALTEYYFAFQLRFFPSEAMKSAKETLRIRKNASLRLYNAYALMEAGLGNLKRAERTWSTMLEMALPNRSDGMSKDWILLVHSRAIAMVRKGEISKALGYLLDPEMAVQGNPGEDSFDIDSRNVGATQRLKTLRIYDEKYRGAYDAGLRMHAVLHIDCMAWFVYLADRFALDSTLQTYEKYTLVVSAQDDNLTLELLHQARAELLRYHIESKRPYKPAIVRALLDASIKLYPNNSCFYDVQYFVGSQNRIDDRLRDAFQAHTSNPSDSGLVSWSYAIAREVARCNLDGSGATANSVRALFSKALLTPDSDVKHSPHLWQSWFNFERSLLVSGEASVVKASEDKATQVFYNGLRYLPWYKPWITMGMKHLSRFGDVHEELQRLEDVMGDREMRITVEMNG